jgi:hypothetical protein
MLINLLPGCETAGGAASWVGAAFAPLGNAAARAAALERFRKLRREWVSVALLLLRIVMTVSLPGRSNAPCSMMVACSSMPQLELGK